MRQVITAWLTMLLVVAFAGQGSAQTWKEAKAPKELTVPGKLSFTVAGLFSLPSGELYDDGIQMKSGGGFEVTASYLIGPKLALRLTGQQSGARMDDTRGEPSGAPLPPDEDYRLDKLSGHLYRVMVGVGSVGVRSTDLFPRMVVTFSYDAGVTINDVEYTYYIIDTKTNDSSLINGVRNDKAFISHRIIGSLAPMLSRNLALHVGGTLGMDIQSGKVEGQGSMSGWMFDVGLGLTYWP